MKGQQQPTATHWQAMAMQAWHLQQCTMLSEMCVKQEAVSDCFNVCVKQEAVSDVVKQLAESLFGQKRGELQSQRRESQLRPHQHRLPFKRGR